MIRALERNGIYLQRNKYDMQLYCRSFECSESPKCRKKHKMCLTVNSFGIFAVHFILIFYIIPKKLRKPNKGCSKKKNFEISKKYTNILQ